jgi:hypothetical protein
VGVCKSWRSIGFEQFFLSRWATPDAAIIHPLQLLALVRVPAPLYPVHPRQLHSCVRTSRRTGFQSQALLQPASACQLPGGSCLAGQSETPWGSEAGRRPCRGGRR